MKRILLSCALMALIGVFSRANAQCTVSNVSVTLTSAVSNGSSCNVVADISFDQSANTGNKKIWINLWKANDYSQLPVTGTPSHPAYLSNGSNMPNLVTLSGGTGHNNAPVAIIGINNNVAPVQYFTTYGADNSITPNVGSSITVTPSGSNNHFVLSGVKFTVPGGCANLVLQGDVWSSQSGSSAPPIQCYTNGISFYGDPTINGLVTCSSPRKAQVLITTVSANAISASYNLYIDKGTIGVKDPADILAYSSSSISFSANAPYNSGLLDFTGNNDAGFNSPLLVELVMTIPFGKTIYGTLDNSCAPLPVSFKSVTASRNKQNVLVKWETATEENNRGFYVQRMLPNGEWKNVAFVFSAAANGNSTSLLAYSFNDLNPAKGVSQYRIQQVDMDGKVKYSETRSVRGEEMASKLLVFPNPGVDGKVNVVFDDVASLRDVIVSDVAGRVIKKYNAVNGSSLVIDNLNEGFYSIQVIDRTTATVSVEKVVIKKR